MADNSHTFAKLYEREGKQMLVTKETSDENDFDEGDLPEIHFRTTSASGHSVTMRFTYGDGDWDKRDEVFGKISEDAAWSVVDGALGMDL